MSIPNDQSIIMSYVNTKLRDHYPNLKELCAAEDIDENALKAKLSSAGFEYNESLNRFA